MKTIITTLLAGSLLLSASANAQQEVSLHQAVEQLNKANLEKVNMVIAEKLTLDIQTSLATMMVPKLDNSQNEENVYAVNRKEQIETKAPRGE